MKSIYHTCDVVGLNTDSRGVHWVYIRMMQEAYTKVVLRMQNRNSHVWSLGLTTYIRNTSTELLLVSSHALWGEETEEGLVTVGN